jgi:hypothetical protein
MFVILGVSGKIGTVRFGGEAISATIENETMKILDTPFSPNELRGEPV